jgi:hypothetical protein
MFPVLSCRQLLSHRFLRAQGHADRRLLAHRRVLPRTPETAVMMEMMVVMMITMTHVLMIHQNRNSHTLSLPACCEPSLISFFRPVSHCIFLHLHKM